MRMGRDYPVEQMLDMLCKNGFAQAIALSRRAVEPRFSPCQRRANALNIRMGRDYPGVAGLYEYGFARRKRFRAGSRTVVLIPAHIIFGWAGIRTLGSG